MARKTAKHQIVTPELLEQVNKENLDLIKNFLTYKKASGKRPSTIQAYGYDLNYIMVWNLLYNDNMSFIKWKKRHVLAFQDWCLTENQNSPARIRRLKSTLSSLSNYIQDVLDDEYEDFHSIIRKIENPPLQPVREKTIFTDEQIDSLLDYLIENKYYDRACALALARYSGRRKSELLRFKTTDFTDEHLTCGGALYKSDKIETKGSGINGKQLECFILAKKFKPYFDLWMEERKRRGIDENSTVLFPTAKDNNVSLTTAALDSWAEQFTSFLGVDFYWHAMRHMTVTTFKKIGIPDSAIQNYIGWEDLSMVSVYSDLSADEELSKYFTADGIIVEQKSFNDV